MSNITEKTENDYLKEFANYISLEDPAYPKGIDYLTATFNNFLTHNKNNGILFSAHALKCYKEYFLMDVLTILESKMDQVIKKENISL